jgi:hypothetical protein
MQTITVPDVPFTYARCAELGLSRRRLRELVHQGVLRRVLRGVYLAASLDLTPTVRAQCVALAVEPHHVACDRTAAWVHGVDVLTGAEQDAPPPIETCAVPGRTPTGRRDVDGHRRDLEPSDIMVVDGLRVTTPLRTALDLGCMLRRREAYAALNEFARRHEITTTQLDAEVRRRYAGRRGVRQLRPLIPLVEPRVESPRESWTLLAILEAGLPAPEPQWWVEVGGVPTYRLDFAYPRLRVAVEYDGYEAHERTADQRAHDEERRAWLRAHGWTVIVIRAGDFTGRALDRWTDALQRALRPTYSNRRW